MPPLFWTGKLSPAMKLLVEANNFLSFFTGESNNTAGMKERVKRGYEGDYSQHVQSYDELGYHLQLRSAQIQLNGQRFDGMQVLDVGCGTGALAQIAFDNGATNVVCGDISAMMLQKAQRKEILPHDCLFCCQLDAENLPYKNNAFDAVVSGMTFGVLPNQARAVSEMIRVVKPGGLVCVGAHGPEHYWEAIDACFRSVNKRYILGYRLEWWPRSEKYIRGLLEEAELTEIQSKRVIWRNDFISGAAAYEFFAAISSSWWYARFPPEKIMKDSLKTKAFFERKSIKTVSDDIIVAIGRKPLNG